MLRKEANTITPSTSPATDVEKAPGAVRPEGLGTRLIRPLWVPASQGGRLNAGDLLALLGQG